MAQAGKLRILAVASQERHFLFPNVPTMKEMKLGLDLGNWVGFIAPKGIPADAIATLDQAIGKALKRPEVIKAWHDMGNMIAYQDHKTYTEWLKPHDAYIRSLVESLGLWAAPRK
jgi:tripartite-type tricarboxylate transporter receptor subunit TctC